MQELEIKNVDCHATLVITKNTQSSRSLLPESGADAQSGRSMIEMLGVLAIIGVLSVGGIAGYSKAMHKYRVNKTIEQITLIAGNVRAFFGPQKNYVGACCSTDVNGSCPDNGCSGSSGNIISTWGVESLVENGCPIIKKAKILPDEMITVTDGKITHITNPFGRGVLLGTANKAKDPDNQAFRILYYTAKEDVEECIDLVSQDWTTLGNVIISVSERGCGGSCPSNEQSFLSPVNMDDAVATCSRASGVFQVAFYIDVDPSSTYWQEKINPGS